MTSGDDPLLERASWTDDWFVDAEQVSTEHRSAWLAGLRQLSLTEVAAARTRNAPVVMACADLLDPTHEADQALVLAVLGGMPPYDTRSEPLLEAIARHAVQRDTELRVRMFLCISATVRTAPEVDDRFHSLLESTRDDATEFALRVRVNWVTTLLARFDFVRAVRALRVASELAERIDSHRGRGYVSINYALLHARLGDDAREEQRLAQVRELLGHHDLPGVRHLHVQRMLYRALDRRDWAEVERWSAELERLGHGLVAAPFFELLRRVDAADVAIARQTPAEALEVLRTLREDAPPTFLLSFHLGQVRAKALSQLGDDEGAAAAVRETLDLLRGSADEQPASAALQAALDLCDCARVCQVEDVAAEALAIAARASLRRIVELDLQVRENGIAHPDDRALLVDARQRFVRLRRDLAGRVAEQLSAAHDEVGRAARELLAESDDRWVVCAWCRSVLSEAGNWLPAGHLLDDPHVAAVTHGICDSCAGDVARRPREAST